MQGRGHLLIPMAVRTPIDPVTWLEFTQFGPLDLDQLYYPDRAHPFYLVLSWFGLLLLFKFRLLLHNLMNSTDVQRYPLGPTVTVLLLRPFLQIGL